MVVQQFIPYGRQTISKADVAAVEAVLRTLRETEGMNEREALDHEFTYGWQVFQTEDAKEGLNSFIEKRKPVWTNK